MREQPAGASHAALHLVHAQQQPELVAGGAQLAQEALVRHPHAAFPLDRLDHDGCGLRGDRVAHGVEVAERHVIEARHRRAEALQVLGVAGGRQHGQGPPVEGALEAQHAGALGPSAPVHRAPDHLHHAFVGFRARVAEEHAVGERGGHQARRQALGLRHAVEVRDVHHPGRLIGDGGHQVRMAVTERGGGDAGAEIEEATPVRAEQPGAFAALERDVRSGIGRHQRGYHGGNPAA